MTTYTYDTISVDYTVDALGDEINTNLRQSEISFVVTDNAPFLVFEFLGEIDPDEDSDSLPSVAIGTNQGGFEGFYGIEIDGQFHTAPTFAELLSSTPINDVQIGQVDWGGGQTFAMLVDVFSDGMGTEHIIVMGGDGLPFLENISGAEGLTAFENFVDQIDGAGPVSVPFGPQPGQNIPFNEFGPGILAHVTENDEIETPLNAFGTVIEAGQGNDFVLARGESEDIFGGAGDDTLDGGISFFSSLNGGDGNDLMFAGDSGNSLYGGAGNDTLRGSDGGNEFAFDFIEGGAGDDLIISAVVNSNVFGEEGNDTLVGSLGFDLMQGGGGADIFFPGGNFDDNDGTEDNGFDIIDLGRFENGTSVGPDDDIDTIVVPFEALSEIEISQISDGDRVVVLGAFGDNDVVTVLSDSQFFQPISFDVGGDGTIEETLIIFGVPASGLSTERIDDDLVVHFGTPAPIEAADYAQDFLPQDIDGTDTNDTLVGGTEDDTIDGGAGDDLLTGGDGADDLNGGTGDDGLQGQGGDDALDGGDGNDNLSGSTGNDVLLGGAGDDLMGGGPGNDAIDGNAGNDFMGGGQGDDTMDGGNDADVVNGGPGNDILLGGDGNDTMAGSFGNDSLLGQDGNDDMGGGTGRDTIEGGNGDDTAGGGEGDDLIDGGAGNDFLAGGGRDDVILGGAGNDLINAGNGDDTMTGGEGADLFIFNGFRDGDADVITDFEDGTDRFRMTGVENAPGSGNAGRVEALNITDTAEGALVDYTGHTILVQGIAAADLGVEDFIFL